MKLNKQIVIAFLLLIIVGSVCRVVGFAPQIAMAVFGAAVIKDKRFAILLPLVSMFLSDLLYEGLFYFGFTQYGGFYSGQVENYLLIAALSVFGFWARSLQPTKIVVATLAAPTVFFLVSNFMVWFGGGGLARPKTFDGLMLCYTDALPFFRGSMITTICASAILFGCYFLAQQFVQRKALA